MPFRGVFTIPVTPFDDQGAIDFNGLASCVEFCVESQAHGVVLPVNASEYFTLSDAERLQVIKCGIDTVAGAVPVVAGVSGASPQHALDLACRARDLGADALIALPPTSRQASQAQIEEHFRTLGEGVDLPVFIQDHDPPARSAYMRVPARRAFDRYDLQELDEVLAGMSDLMTWKRGGR